MTITVIIATRERASLLAATLDAFSELEWPGVPFDILVVDNGSMDDTPAVVQQKAQCARVPIAYLAEPTPGKSNALNAAVARAGGDLLVFTDDDVLPSPGWLAAYVRAFAETGADFAAGRVLPLWEAPAPKWLSPDLYAALSVVDGGTQRVRLTRGAADFIMPIGANMAVRRHVVDRVGGWNPDLGKLQGTLRTGEDHEFMLKITAAGFAGVYEPEACVRHRVPVDRLRLAYFQRWFWDNGVIEAGFEREYPTTDRYLLGTPRYLWRECAHELLATGWAVPTWNARRATVGLVRLAWFGGYLRGRQNNRCADIPASTGSATA
jgi:glycosyltransferase involved in cell wall biosynthesis